jgi:hypothetical protein
MKISDEDVRKLRKYARVKPVRNVHTEDVALYQSGLVDGMALLATEILAQLKPDDVPVPIGVYREGVIPEEEKESE